eukprot:2815460-Prymnesium_polylepis.1
MGGCRSCELWVRDTKVGGECGPPQLQQASRGGGSGRVATQRHSPRQAARPRACPAGRRATRGWRGARRPRTRPSGCSARRSRRTPPPPAAGCP